ncbi:hypothetical protein BBJ28_00016874 [Nothophytophthora sp. Chile5]|nr:hypothetical protein BBJ28_00016874 [Nothophytophthora sp. Chile5]
MAAFVIAWEDVLAPMAFLTSRVGLQPTKSCMEAAKNCYVRDQYLQQALAAVEEQAIELLRVAATMGPVFVITEKSLKYMETTCAAFLPRLAHWLANANLAAASAQHFRVRVVAAPKKFATTMENAAWRVQLYQHICKAVVCDAHSASLSAASSLSHAHRMLQFRESGTLGLVSLSTSEMDQFASVKAFDVAPFLVPKCVHLNGGEPATALSLEHFFAQLRTLQRYVVTATAHDSAFAVTL